MSAASNTALSSRAEETTAAISRETFHERLRAADIAFGAVNTMPDLSRHGALRRITVGTPNGDIAMPAPAVVRGKARDDYGPAPGYDEHGTRIRREFSE